MALKFGTSGVRGLVAEMSDRECALYTRAFLSYVQSQHHFSRVAAAGDLRDSTSRILQAVASSILYEGCSFTNCGKIATPALTMYGMAENIPSIMITGSHIPADRNGIKFNMPWGEVLKSDEAEIAQQYRRLRAAEDPDFASIFAEDGSILPERRKSLVHSSRENARSIVEKIYSDRYVSFFGSGALVNMKILVYQHSSVSRDILPEILCRMGAEVVCVGRSDRFIAVDTEAIDNIPKLTAWFTEHQPDALVSTDGDGDRPLVVDETGAVVRGDVLGILTASLLGADSVATPVSSNSAVEKCGWFQKVYRTRIGSPHVIEAMQQASEDEPTHTVVGYEANGGFLTGGEIDWQETGSRLSPLPTRDAVLPILSCLLLSKRRGKTLSQLHDLMPARFTASGLIREFPTEYGSAIVSRLAHGSRPVAEGYFYSAFGSVDGIDFVDGVRMTFQSGDIVHLRPSGNAPEFRCYSESTSAQNARRINSRALEIVREVMLPEVMQFGDV